MANVEQNSGNVENQKTWTVILGHFLPSLHHQHTKTEAPCIKDLSQEKTTNTLQETVGRGWSALVQNGLIPRVFLVTDASESLEEKPSSQEQNEEEAAVEKKMPEDLASKVKDILSSTAREAVERTGVLENLSMWTWGSSLSKWLSATLEQSLQHNTSQQNARRETESEAEPTNNSSSVCVDIEPLAEESAVQRTENQQTEKKELQSYVIIVENCVIDYFSQTKDYLSSTVDSVKTRLADSSSSVIELGNNTVQSFMQMTSLQTFKDTLSTYSFVQGLQAFSNYLVEVPDLFQEPDLRALNREEDVDWGLLHHEEPIPKVHVVYIGRR